MSTEISRYIQCVISLEYHLFCREGSCFVRRGHVLFVNCIYSRILESNAIFISDGLYSNTTGNPSGAHEFSLDFSSSGIRVARSFSFCVVFCRSLFVLLAIISSICPLIYGFFKLYL